MNITYIKKELNNKCLSLIKNSSGSASALSSKTSNPLVINATILCELLLILKCINYELVSYDDIKTPLERQTMFFDYMQELCGDELTSDDVIDDIMQYRCYEPWEAVAYIFEQDTNGNVTPETVAHIIEHIYDQN